MIYTFDTETCYDGSRAWIWMYGLCDESFNVTVGPGERALTALLDLPHGSEVYVHNLSFDGNFLVWELVERGFIPKYDLKKGVKSHGYFTTNEDTSGILSMTIYYRGRTIVLRDSFRLFRCKLEKLPKTCGFEDLDAKARPINYDAVRPRNHEPTHEERDYQTHDVTVLMRAIKWIRSKSATGNTIGSIAVQSWRKTRGNVSPFIPLTGDERDRLRSLYSGGIVHVARPGLSVGVNGRTYDRNSMYPAESVGELPVALSDQDRDDGRTALHIVARGLKLRPGGLPMCVTPFTSSGRSVVDYLDRWVFADEWETWLEEYDVTEWLIVERQAFEWAPVCREFMYQWYEAKSTATTPEARTYAKFMLNNLTGKFGENDRRDLVRLQIVDGVPVGYRYEEISELNKWAFMPAVARITSQSRRALRAAVIASGRDNLYYTDTDSVHTSGVLPAAMVDSRALGAWKVENVWSEACFVKPKTYYERGDVVVCKHAGINDDATLARRLDDGTWTDTGELIGPENLRAGNYFFTRHQKKVTGGIIIERSPKVV